MAVQKDAQFIDQRRNVGGLGDAEDVPVRASDVGVRLILVEELPIHAVDVLDRVGIRRIVEHRDAELQRGEKFSLRVC